MTDKPILNFDLQAGDIFLTRNADDDGNPFPGYWNHTAILSFGGWVVEAQIEPRAVICVPLSDFLKRYPQIRVLRSVYHRDDLAYQAAKLVGKKYNKIASLFPFSFKENCVSVVRKAFYRATNIMPPWKIPDDINISWLTKFVVDITIEHWVKPDQWFPNFLLKFPENLLTEYELKNGTKKSQS